MKIKSLLIIALVIVIGVGAYILFFSKSEGTQILQNQKAGERKILYYRAPMDPNEIYDEPGKSKMGMDLVPVYEDESGASGIVKIDPSVVQNMNVKLVTIEKKNLSSKVITNGVLKSNEKTDYIVTTKVSGWIEKLYVNFTGQRVTKGEKLMDIYSPELVAAQQELLTAISYDSKVNRSTISDVLKSGNELVKNAVQKLQLLEIPNKDIEKLKQSKEIKTYVTLYAPSSGTVINKNVINGQKITAGMPLLQISNLSTLWLLADIYEYELSKIDVGSPAKINYNYLPGLTFDGRISFIYPTIDPKSRTVKVRLDINNSNGKLKPEMFANVEISGKNLGASPVIPENSVIRSGTKDIVIISLGNGKFKPQQVTLGGYSNGYYQVLKGLTEGTQIVTSAQFFIDSESNLRAAIGQLQDTHKDSTAMDMQTNPNKIMNDNSDKKEVTSALIRKEPIDVEAIDKNKDGKVFQDIMDWNVISDKPGKCPICGMTLKEFSVKEAKENLIKNGFKIK